MEQLNDFLKLAILKLLKSSGRCKNECTLEFYVNEINYCSLFYSKYNFLDKSLNLLSCLKLSRMFIKSLLFSTYNSEQRRLTSGSLPLPILECRERRDLSHP